MSLVDPECYPRYHRDGRRVCAGCFGDFDIKEMIRNAGEFSTCDFCSTRRAKTLEVGEVCEHILDRAEQFYGKAVDQLPFESREGGYQGNHFDSYDLLVDQIGIELPRDDEGTLLDTLVGELGDDFWCAYDWTQLELDESLEFSWRRFARIVMHERRFFFHHLGDQASFSDDDRSPLRLLNDIMSVLRQLGRVRTIPAGLKLYRARPRVAGEKHKTAASLGPPPAAFALQSNRMNPPGIPMFYGAETSKLAMAEVRDQRVSLGRFATLRPIRIVDLVDLPEIPGFFSQASREQRQYLSFLHSFAREISKPVPRNDRIHIDYLPTQVFTEFLRDAKFGEAPIDGIRYPTATHAGGANIVLFATQSDVVGGTESFSRAAPWLRLDNVVQKRGLI